MTIGRQPNDVDARRRAIVRVDRPDGTTYTATLVGIGSGRGGPGRVPAGKARVMRPPSTYLTEPTSTVTVLGYP